MTDKPTILYPPGLSFHSMRQRPQQLMIQLAKMGYECIFGQQVVSLIGKEVYLYRGEYMRPSGVEDNLQLCLNCHRYVNDNPDKKIILYCSSGRGHVWADFLNPYAVIYDELDHFPAWERDARIACVKADRIMYSAHTLGEVLKQRAEDHPEIAPFTYVPNACEFEHWSIPFKEIPQPPYKIMYIGAFAVWLDFDFIINTVKSLPQFEFWFLGARFDSHPSVRGKVDELLHYPNVTALPQIPYEDLPCFVEDADVLWIPFDNSERVLQHGDFMYPVSEITDFVNPIKLWEYLATGKPIYYTPIKEMRYILSDLRKESVSLPLFEVNDFKEFVRSVVDMFGKPGTCPINLRGEFENARAVAKNHTWEQSAEIMAKLIEDIMQADLDAEIDVRVKLAEARKKDPEARPKFTGISDPTVPEELV